MVSQRFAGEYLAVAGSKKFGHVSNVLPIEVLTPSIVSVAVEISTNEIVVGGAAELLAMATLGDGSSIDVSGSAEWSVSDATVAQVIPIAPVLVVGHAQGTAEIIASVGAVISDPVLVTVSPAQTATLSLTAYAVESRPHEDPPAPLT